MANAVIFDYFTELAGTVNLPANRGPFASSGLILFQRQTLPTDPIGTHTLTLTNVVVGSRVHIESQDGATQHYDAIAASSTVVPVINVYSAGDAKNNWRIRVRKGTSAPFYIPYETLMTATVGSSSIYVGQIPDE